MPVSAPARDRPDPRTSGVLGAATASTLVYSAAVSIPYMGLLAAVSPFPIIVLRIRNSLGAALLATMLAAGTIGSIFSLGLAVVYLVVFAVPGLLIGEAMARGRGLRRGCAWAFALLAVQIGLALLVDGDAMAARVLEPIDQYRSPEFLAEVQRRNLVQDAPHNPQFAELMDKLESIVVADGKLTITSKAKQ